jgi:hypothetical protein
VGVPTRTRAGCLDACALPAGSRRCNGTQRTVLHMAASSEPSAFQLVEALVNAGAAVSQEDGDTAMKKLRIVILGFGAARQKTVLE